MRFLAWSHPALDLGVLFPLEDAREAIRSIMRSKLPSAKWRLLMPLPYHVLDPDPKAFDYAGRSIGPGVWIVSGEKMAEYYDYDEDDVLGRLYDGPGEDFDQAGLMAGGDGKLFRLYSWSDPEGMKTDIPLEVSPPLSMKDLLGA